MTSRANVISARKVSLPQKDSDRAIESGVVTDTAVSDRLAVLWPTILRSIFQSSILHVWDLSYLRPEEQNRIRARQFDARELSLLLQKQNPWTRSGKPEPLPLPAPQSKEPTLDDLPKTEEPPKDKSPGPYLGRVSQGERLGTIMERQLRQNEAETQKLVKQLPAEPKTPPQTSIPDQPEPTPSTGADAAPIDFTSTRKRKTPKDEKGLPESDEDRRMRKQEELQSRAESLQRRQESERWRREFSERYAVTPISEAHPTEPHTDNLGRAADPAPPPRRKINPVEWISLVLAFVLGAAGFIVGALAAAGIISMDLAKLMLGASLFLLVVGAIVVEWLAGRSWRRIVISTLVVGIISTVLLFGIISPWMEKKKKDQDQINGRSSDIPSSQAPIQQPNRPPVATPSPTPSAAASRRQKKSAPKPPRCSAENRLLGRC